ncbi:MAG: hypothetical protein R3E58_14165 [Phycisphaerae bacterium]
MRGDQGGNAMADCTAQTQSVVVQVIQTYRIFSVHIEQNCFARHLLWAVILRDQSVPAVLPSRTLATSPHTGKPSVRAMMLGSFGEWRFYDPEEIFGRSRSIETICFMAFISGLIHRGRNAVCLNSTTAFARTFYSLVRERGNTGMPSFVSVPCGNWKSFYEDGTLKCDVVHADGSVSTEKRWYMKMASLRRLDRSEGTMEGPTRFWYSNGS